jgi:hypothetical protein
MKNRVVLVAVLCAAISVVAFVAQSAEKNPLVGVWEVKVSAGGVPPAPSTEHRDLRRGWQFYHDR